MASVDDQPDGDGRAFRIRHFRSGQLPPVNLERDPVAVMPPQQLVEGRIEQRLEMSPERLLEIAGIEQRRQLICQSQSYRRGRQAWRRNPLPRRAMT